MPLVEANPLVSLANNVDATLRDEHNPDGDIAITCTGMRPGEKLYQELLIEADSEPTTHPFIYRAREASLPPEALWPQLDALEAALAARD